LRWRLLHLPKGTPFDRPLNALLPSAGAARESVAGTVPVHHCAINPGGPFRGYKIDFGHSHETQNHSNPRLLKIASGEPFWYNQPLLMTTVAFFPFNKPVREPDPSAI